MRVNAGDIGEPRRKIILVPIPETAPIEEPSPELVPETEPELVPA